METTEVKRWHATWMPPMGDRQGPQVQASTVILQTFTKNTTYWRCDCETLTFQVKLFLPQQKWRDWSLISSKAVRAVGTVVQQIVS